MDIKNAKIDDVMNNIVNNIERNPRYSEDFSSLASSIVKDDVKFQSDHTSLWFCDDELIEKYGRYWLAFIDAFTTRDECVMGEIDDDNKHKSSVVINLNTITPYVAMDMFNAFFIANNGYAGNFEYSGETLTWKFEREEFYVEFNDH